MAGGDAVTAEVTCARVLHGTAGSPSGGQEGSWVMEEE